MEDLYFGLFLLFLAGAFLWVWSKARLGKKHDKSVRLHPSGRLIEDDKLDRKIDRRPHPPRLRTISAVDAHRSNQMWRTRRQRATEAASRRPAGSDDVMYANYVGDSEKKSDRSIKEQSISEAEHISIGEYLAKQELEQTQPGDDKAEFSMTAVKYEPSDSESSAEGDPALKKSGTKD